MSDRLQLDFLRLLVSENVLEIRCNPSYSNHFLAPHFPQIPENPKWYNDILVRHQQEVSSFQYFDPSRAAERYRSLLHIVCNESLNCLPESS